MLSNKLSSTLKKKITLEEKGEISVIVEGKSEIQNDITSFCNIISWNNNHGHVKLQVEDLEKLSTINNVVFIELSKFS